ncbi:uncharacterized protein si:ch211-63p21.1 [Brachionichthys hirsutus]|uniref:uncharacterized protein si:ch211-63p21.1 n=1 Tax=Brachionichthys hirsutus TaxID=412623 RepID=UPI0036050675
MLRRGVGSHDLLPSGETSDNDCEMGAGCGEEDRPCLCEEAGPCALCSEACAPTPDALLCEHCGKSRVMITRYSEGYGTEEDCVLSDPRGESDADADIEDTDSRLQESGSLQRISSRRRKRPRVARQDTTESEDDGGRSHGSDRWNLRLSPDRAHGRAIPEESVSQVRPLVVCQPNAERLKNPLETPRGSRRVWPSSSSFPMVLLLLLLSLALIVIIVSFFLPLTGS